MNIPAEDTSCVERVSKKKSEDGKKKQSKTENLVVVQGAKLLQAFSQEKGDNFAHKNGCCVLRTSKYVAW